MRLTVVARVVLFLSLGAASDAYAQTPDTTRITATRLAEGVYVLMGEGGNIGLSTGPNGAFLIDDEYAPLTDRIRATVDSLCACPVRFVLNTHWHRDHTGGNENLGKAGVLIVAVGTGACFVLNAVSFIFIIAAFNLVANCLFVSVNISSRLHSKGM